MLVSYWCAYKTYFLMLYQCNVIFTWGKNPNKLKTKQKQQSLAENITISQIMKWFPEQKLSSKSVASKKSLRAVLSIYIAKKKTPNLLKCIWWVFFVSFLASMKNACMIAQSHSFKEQFWFDLKKLHNTGFATSTVLASGMNEMLSTYQTEIHTVVLRI